MNNDTAKTPRGRGFGFLESDPAEIRRFMNDLGWTESRLAKEAKLSQPMINAFLNGNRKLSSTASDRVLAALRTGFLARAESLKNAAREFDPTLSQLFALQTVVANQPGEDIWRAAENLRAERARNAELATELANSRKLNSAQEEIISAQKRMIESRDRVIANDNQIASIYKGWVEHLQQQLRDAGINPTDYIPPTD